MHPIFRRSRYEGCLSRRYFSFFEIISIKIISEYRDVCKAEEELFTNRKVKTGQVIPIYLSLNKKPSANGDRLSRSLLAVMPNVKPCFLLFRKLSFYCLTDPSYHRLPRHIIKQKPQRRLFYGRQTERLYFIT